MQSAVVIDETSFGAEQILIWILCSHLISCGLGATGSTSVLSHSQRSKPNTVFLFLKSLYVEQTPSQH